VRHYRSGTEIVANNAYCREVERELRKNCSSAGAGAENCEITVKTGVPWEEILKLARGIKVDLILLNPRTEKGAAERIGSTVGGVIRRERCPVMIVNQLPSREQLEFRNLMVCIDFSTSCVHALGFAVKLAQVYASKIHLLHVLQTAEKSERKRKTRIEEAHKRLEDFSSRIAAGILKEDLIRQGSHPHLEILHAARENEADLIIMGSHTKAVGTQWYVGSVAERVSTHSFCPVTIVTDPQSIERR
jgi:nucleotide-binding universal stress UspA family protein